MTNQEIVRAMAIGAPVYTSQRRYRHIYEYCITTDRAGNKMNIAGVISEDGVLRYVDIRDLACDTPLPAELPLLDWSNNDLSISQVMQLLQTREAVVAAGRHYKRIKAISLYKYPSGNLRYRIVLDANENATVTVDPMALSFPAQESL